LLDKAKERDLRRGEDHRGVPLARRRRLNVRFGVQAGVRHPGAGEEAGNKYDVRTKEQADHSLPYLVAVALLDGRSRGGCSHSSGSNEARTTTAAQGADTT
jgi:2-methylcitrate dehydratase